MTKDAYSDFEYINVHCLVPAPENYQMIGV